LRPGRHTGPGDGGNKRDEKKIRFGDVVWVHIVMKSRFAQSSSIPSV
jgi:hypothetical protein